MHQSSQMPLLSESLLDSSLLLVDYSRVDVLWLVFYVSLSLVEKFRFLFSQKHFATIFVVACFSPSSWHVVKTCAPKVLVYNRTFVPKLP